MYLALQSDFQLEEASGYIFIPQHLVQIYTPHVMCKSVSCGSNGRPTSLTQSSMNEISRLCEEWAQVKIFTVCCFHSMILYVGVFVETWPRVNVLGAICSIHHVCNSQIH